MKIFMMDVESIGLHGEGFAVAWLVHDTKTGAELDSGCYSAGPDAAEGLQEDREWVMANVDLSMRWTHDNLESMQRDFWAVWERWREDGAVAAADCPWPVESRFLAECMDAGLAGSRWDGPYPILDVVSARMGAGETLAEVMAPGERLPNELPAHNPLADCRQSMRLLLWALRRTAP